MPSDHEFFRLSLLADAQELFGGVLLITTLFELHEEVVNLEPDKFCWLNFIVFLKIKANNIVRV